MTLKFGTDGWRAIISDEFTFENVRKVSRAVALYLINHGFADKPLIIGYDARFLADKFALAVAKVMEEAGIDVLLAQRDTPTPVLAWEVKERKAAGAVVLTASHNPPEYCGFKFIPDYAGPANEQITTELQANSNQPLVLPIPAKKGKIEHFDPRDRYLQAIEKFFDLNLIRQVKIKVVYDAMHGSGRGYLDLLLEKFGCQVVTINANRDVLFGGHNPEPDDENLTDLKKKVMEVSANVGLANDGDADRFGIVDEKGEFYSANRILPLLFDYLITERKFTGGVARSVATTSFIDRIAARHNIKVFETPVGFKHIAKAMLENEIIIGGEESGGLSIKGHIPEKDGILADLLVVEMLAKKKKSLSAIWNELIAVYGGAFNERINLKLDEKTKNAFMEKLKTGNIDALAGIKVVTVNKVDGVKLVLADGSWILARPSGTEPLVRIYAEANTQEKLTALLAAAQKLL